MGVQASKGTNPHAIKWHRTPLSKETSKAVHAVSDARGLVQAGGWLAMLGAWFGLALHHQKEGNAWLEHLVTPVRERVTSRLPRPALLALSYGLTLPLHAAARAARRAPLPYGDYLRWLGRYPFQHNLQVVFDHLQVVLEGVSP